MRGSIVVLSLLLGLLALPATAAAAGSCELTTAVSPGNEITITGSGFAASTSIDLTTTWSGSNATAGGNTGPQTTTTKETSDASGGFTFRIDAGPGHGGTYDVEAGDGSCTATTQIAALETAGGVNPGGATATPPATDTAPLGDRGHSPVPLPLLPVGGGVILIGLAVVLARRRAADARTAAVIRR